MTGQSGRNRFVPFRTSWKVCESGSGVKTQEIWICQVLREAGSEGAEVVALVIGDEVVASVIEDEAVVVEEVPVWAA